MATEPDRPLSSDLLRPGAAETGRGRALLIGAAAIAAAAAARAGLEQLVPGVLPFLFTFPAVIAATLAAGAVAGGTALAGCQLLTIAFVLPHWVRDSGDRPQEAVNLLLATASLIAGLWATAAYRRAQLRFRRRCEREVDTLSLLVNEIDHRTKNNFQLAATLLHAQGLDTTDAEVRSQLDLAAARLVSIAAVYGTLSSRRPEAGPVALLAHLEEIGEGLRAGLLPAGVAVEVAGEEAEVPAATALTIGLVVNEWITNAAKHAFPAGGGTVHVGLARRAGRLLVEVRDAGGGRASDAVPGTGSRLIASLADALGARVAQRNDGGLVCTLDVPIAAAA